MSVGVIRGGVSVNVVPDQCSIEIDRRLRPEEDPRRAYQHLIDYVAQAPETLHGQNMIRPISKLPALRTTPTARSPTAFANRPRGQRPGRNGRGCLRDGCRLLAAAGIPTVVLVPAPSPAHTADEWISIDEYSRPRRFSTDSREVALRLRRPCEW